MSLPHAIVTAFSHAFDFRGRANRREFWYFLLFAVIVWLALLTFDLDFMAEWLGFMPMEEGAPRYFSNAWALICIVPFVSLVARRVHDHGYSGWWALTVLPLAWWLVAKGSKEPNRFG